MFLDPGQRAFAVGVLVPGVRWLMEWAYAGLTFDLIGALYSHVAVGDRPSAWAFPIIGLLLVARGHTSSIEDNRTARAGTLRRGVWT
jgi:hypothetical protein